VTSTTSTAGSGSGSGNATGSGAAESSAYLSSVLSVETSTPTSTSGSGNATGTGSPPQYTGTAVRGESKGSAWVAMVGFGIFGLVLL